MQFFTATCLNWQNLLAHERHQQIIMDSLKFLVESNRIWLYGFVLMPNHIHLLWNSQEAWANKNIQQMFLKYTAQQMKFNLKDSGNNTELEKYRSTQQDREYHFWERRPRKIRYTTVKLLNKNWNTCITILLKPGSVNFPKTIAAHQQNSIS